MILNEIAGLMRSLRGWVSEPTRAAVIQGICKMTSVSIDDEKASAWWEAQGKYNFIVDCVSDHDPATTPDDLTVEPSKLALFINKWRATVAYKTAEGAFEDLSPEMKALITTMTEDLEDLAVEMPE